MEENQTIFLAVEILYSFELGHALEGAVQSVVPTVVRAVKNAGLSARLRYYGSRVVAANIVKAPQDAIVTTNHDDRFSRDAGSNKLAGLLNLLDATDHLPRLAEHSSGFKLSDPRIHVPRCWDGVGVSQRGFSVVKRENVLD